MTRIKSNFGKPLPISIVSMFVSIYTVVVMVMLLAIVCVAYRNDIPQLLMVTPVVIVYLLTLYTYLANRLREEFKERLSKANKKPKMVFE